MHAGDGAAEDRPAPGCTYLCRAPGGFKLLSGRLRPFPRARAASTMLARAAALLSKHAVRVHKVLARRSAAHATPCGFSPLAPAPTQRSARALPGGYGRARVG